MLKEILKNASGVPTGEYKDVAGGTLYADSPLGTILPFGGAAAPIGWFLCQGQAISRITYADLFAVIGTSFGAGDGSTTFNIPDLRGEFLRGAGTNSHSGQGDGGAVGEHQNGTTVSTSIMGNGYGVIYNMANGFVDNSTYDKWVGNSGNTYLHNTSGQETESYGTRIGTGKARPTNTSVNYIIKAQMVALPADLDSAVDAKIAAKGVYSTSEVDTGKTWIDGKKIYRKVYNGTISASGQTLITASNVDSLVSYDGWYRVNTTCYKGWYDVQSGATWPVVTVSDHNLNLRFDSTSTPIASVQWVCCIVEYTKTT